MGGFLWRVKRVGDVPKGEVERIRGLMLSWGREKGKVRIFVVK